MSQMKCTDNPPIPDRPEASGQTTAHQQDIHDEPMRDMTIAFAGDQLTCVRFAGRKDLLSGLHTATDRFEHRLPFKPVIWHP